MLAPQRECITFATASTFSVRDLLLRRDQITRKLRPNLENNLFERCTERNGCPLPLRSREAMGYVVGRSMAGFAAPDNILYFACCTRNIGVGPHGSAAQGTSRACLLSCAGRIATVAMSLWSRPLSMTRRGKTCLVAKARPLLVHSCAVRKCTKRLSARPLPEYFLTAWVYHMGSSRSAA